MEDQQSRLACKKGGVHDIDKSRPICPLSVVYKRKPRSQKGEQRGRRIHPAEDVMGQVDVAVEEVGVEVVDDLLHCPSGRGDGIELAKFWRALRVLVPVSSA
ncbi:unnamed protein product [Heligmosomoides polygyrus]|uniref:Uncharacterized protein n=1 Tax=Heligmosomoides polygyrus TaxID=6339 RepID=A0A183F4U2_HELPZ|nr:unnamed protein product [Heligmosomoides polygyrus]